MTITLRSQARIYAEDPLRGFLPSTGPLLEYIEPEAGNDGNSCEVRVDSGVVAGSIISQYYDPMISKLVVHSPDGRTESIHGLRRAINGYVISGIGHNCSFLTDVLRHEAFLNGETPTNFIQMHYPDGFQGVKLSNVEEAELAVIALSASMWRGNELQRPPMPLSSEMEEDMEVIICLGGMFGKPFRVKSIDWPEAVYSVTPLDEGDAGEAQTVNVDSMEMGVSSPIIDVTVNGKDKIVQIEKEDSTGVFGVKFEGATYDAIVMSPKEYELSRYMKKPIKVDTSNLILSPMPGTLISYAVEVRLSSSFVLPL